MKSLARTIFISLLAITPIISCTGDDGKNRDSNQLDPNATTVVLKVNGMTCGACESTIEASLKDVEGVQSAVASTSTNSVEVTFNPKTVNLATIKKTIQDTGYKLID